MVRIRLFGAIDLRDGDDRELRGVLAQPKRLALLAYLAAASPAGLAHLGVRHIDIPITPDKLPCRSVALTPGNI